VGWSLTKNESAGYNSWMLQIDPRVSISSNARSLVRLHRWMCPLLAKRASIEIIFCIPCCSVMLFLYWQYDHWYRNSTIYSPPNKANGNGPILSTSEMIRVKKLRTKKSGAFAATCRNRNWWPKVCNLGAYGGRTCCPPPPLFFLRVFMGCLQLFAIVRKFLIENGEN
jgi:hypothetical protein